MSAERLREAVALMRERAEVVVFDTKWHVDPDEPQRWLSGALIIGESSEDSIAAHCASWNPIVVERVACLLTSLADRHDEILSNFAEGSRAGAVTAAENVPGYLDALALADAYLGGAA